MPKYISEKVINIFEKSKNKNSSNCNCDEKIHKSEQGYDYVCFTTDDNGREFNTEKIIKNANESQYIVKVLTEENHIYSYKVTGAKLLDFLQTYTNNEKQGKIIEIDKFYPGDLA